MPILHNREVHFLLLISKRSSGIDVVDFPAPLARSIKPPPLPERALNELAKELFPPGLPDPSVVISIDNPETAVAILEFIRTKGIPKSALAVRAAINTQRDQDGADLPPHVLELARQTGCKVGFSFVYTSPR